MQIQLGKMTISVDQTQRTRMSDSSSDLFKLLSNFLHTFSQPQLKPKLRLRKKQRRKLILRNHVSLKSFSS
ncbi:unnamed protein product [Arabidopsis halleri]